MRVIFCTSGIGALGETYSTALFARQLLENGHECFFIIPKLGGEYLKTFGFKIQSIYVLPSNKGGKYDIKENYQFFKEFVTLASPDFVVAVDWHQFGTDGYAYNYTYSINWFEDNIKIGTLDHFGFAPHGAEVKIHRSFETENKIFSPLSNRYSFIIRPCPHHDNSVNQINNIYYWSLFKNKISNTSVKKNMLRKQQLKNHSKTILHPIGFWQQRILEREFQKKNIKCDYYFDILLPMIYECISKTNIKVTYIIISGNIKKELRSQYKNIDIIIKPPMNNELFTSLLLIADIFVTDNIMSSNLGKAVFANKVPIVFKNSLNPECKQSNGVFRSSSLIKKKFTFLLENDLLFPYISFPLGFNELTSMYQNNNFSSTFFQQEIFEEDSNIQLFSNLLNNRENYTSIYESQNQYISNSKNLFLANEIMEQV